MEIKYKREHNESQMIIENGGTKFCSFEEKMLENNDIPCILKTTTLELNGITSSIYSISKKESLRDYFDNQDVTLEMIQKAFIYIQLGLEEMSNYLLDQNHLILSEDTIFFGREEDGFRAYFCLNPSQNEGVQIQIRKLVEWILSVLPTGDVKLSATMSNVYSSCLNEDFTISELVEIISLEIEETMEKKAVEVEDLHRELPQPEEIKVEKIVLDDEETDDIACFYDEEKGIFEQFIDEIRTVFKDKKKHKIYPDRIKEDFVVDPSEEISEPTVLIRPEDMKCTGKLVYDGDYNEQNFVLTKSVFKIGTAEGNDGILSSKTVSRHHAKITSENGKYFIEDMNSTNGTFINGRTLQYRNPVRLKTMDRIMFGDVSYVFM